MNSQSQKTIEVKESYFKAILTREEYYKLKYHDIYMENEKLRQQNARLAEALDSMLTVLKPMFGESIFEDDIKLLNEIKASGD